MLRCKFRFETQQNPHTFAAFRGHNCNAQIHLFNTDLHEANVVAFQQDSAELRPLVVGNIVFLCFVKSQVHELVETLKMSD